jgi:hypothetical protein
MLSQIEKIRFVKGQWVEVCTETEIAATLDSEGKLDGVPFMPEMRGYCGKRFQVHRRADKTCVEGHGMRRMDAAVFLDRVRCDGAAHDGCQRDCLIFWKEAWLKPASGIEASVAEPEVCEPAQLKLRNLKTRQGDRYVCQSTALAASTKKLSKWNFVHFFSEIDAGELTYGQLARIVARVLINRARVLFGFRELRALAGPQKKTARGELNLQPGDTVEIKSLSEIRAHLDPNGRNCGLSFEPDMTFYAGQTFEVARPVQKIIREETGKMVSIANTVALKGVVCAGVCAKNCPRANPHFWRESWLKRTSEPQSSQSGVAAAE